MPGKKKGFKIEITDSKRLNRVQFIAMKDEIRRNLELGYSGKDIYDELKKKKQIDYGYPMFMRYVNSIIKESDEQNNKTEKQENTEDKKSSKEPAEFSPRNAKRNLL